MIYGLLSVSRRTREIGLRIAMGARSSDVLRMILGSGLRLVITGGIVGLLVSLMATKVLAGLLFEITPNDPLTLAVVIFSLVTIGMFAMFLPAKRAASVDPLQALRYE